MPASLEAPGAAVDFSEAGVARQFVEQVMVDAGAFQALAHQAQGLQGEHAGIGDQQGPACARQRATPRQLFQGADAAEDIGGVVPVMQVAHGDAP